MPKRSPDQRAPALGFLTVVRHDPLGIVGGLLLVDPLARPVEFHCTLPVRPNRTQEILFGPSLEPYLCGEQIAPALLDKAGQTPVAVLTDRPEVLTARPLCDLPLGYLLPPDENSASEETRWRLDAAHPSVAPSAAFALGRARCAVAAAYADDARLLTAALAAWGEPFDLHEPFERIREAIQETHRAPR